MNVYLSIGYAYSIVYNELTKCFKCDFRALDYNINSQLTRFLEEKWNKLEKILYENVFFIVTCEFEKKFLIKSVT